MGVVSEWVWSVGVVCAGDPVEFLVWLLHTLHSALGGNRRPGSSEVHNIFQGTMRIYTRKLPPASEVGGVSLVAMVTCVCVE